MMLSPLFEGKLVRLTAPRDDDKAVFALWSQNADFLRLLDDDPIRPQNEAYFEHFGEKRDENDFYFHLRLVDEAVLIGFVVLFNIKWRNQSAELAIGIGDTNYRGKGYGRDALQLILNYAFSELGLHRVGLSVIAYNASAIKAYERVGFVWEGVVRQAVMREGKRYDLLLYGILREEWTKQD